jgi:hypothetical protein
MQESVRMSDRKMSRVDLQALADFRYQNRAASRRSVARACSAFRSMSIEGESHSLRGFGWIHDMQLGQACVVPLHQNRRPAYSIVSIARVFARALGPAI